MATLASNASDDEILSLISEWVDLLALERYEAAASLLRARSDWTPELLKAVIEGYGMPTPHPGGKVFRVTSTTTARRSNHGPTHHRQHVQRWIPNAIDTVGMVEYDLPLNGYWSDLSALFNLKLTDAGLVVELEDIHVL